MSGAGEYVSHGHVYPRPDGAKARCGGVNFCRQCRREAMGMQTPPADQVHWPQAETPHLILVRTQVEPTEALADRLDAEAVERAQEREALRRHDEFCGTDPDNCSCF